MGDALSLLLQVFVLLLLLALLALALALTLTLTLEPPDAGLRTGDDICALVLGRRMAADILFNRCNVIKRMSIVVVATIERVENE